MIIKTLLTGIY